MQEVLQYKYWGNTLLSYLTTLGILLLGIILIIVIKRILLIRLRRWAERSDNKIDDFIVDGVQRSLIPMMYIGVFYISISHLILPATIKKGVALLISIGITFFVVKIITATLKFALLGYLARQENGEGKTKQVRGIMIIAAAFVWITGVLFLLDNWGVNVTTFVAGLGIGGIAVALAAQTILGDLFSYFVIFFDRPFEIGDFIIVQDKMGTVEYIGIKTTRLRSLSGEQLVFSNTDLTNSRVHNYKRMERRRIVFQIGVPYETPKEKLAMIPEIIKDIIKRQPDLTLDRAHLQNLADSQVVYEVVYFVQTGDFNKYMDRQQAIYLELFDIFTREGIEFAYPTQTLFLQRQAAQNNNG